MSIEISEEIRKNFHLFWDNYPAPVILAYKDKTIIEANKAGQDYGFPVGTRCIDLGEKEHHAGCLANKALGGGAGMRAVFYAEHLGQVVDVYWIPLAGSSDLYVHFFNDITEYAADRLLPTECCKC
ncbi:MAG: hypothetical protein WCA04_14140 [Geobacteraceae bacterium]